MPRQIRHLQRQPQIARQRAQIAPPSQSAMHGQRGRAFWIAQRLPVDLIHIDTPKWSARKSSRS